MKVGLFIYGSLDTISGGYLYDRELVTHLRSRGDVVEIVSIRSRNYLLNLLDNLSFRLPSHLDILIQDELVHRSLLLPNRRPHSYPIISLVHNLRSSEARPPWHNRFFRLIEKLYLETVDGFIFNSETTHQAVSRLVNEKRNVVAAPGGDRLGSVSESTLKIGKYKNETLRVIFLANVTRLKGLHVLLEAIGRQPCRVLLDVVGSLNVEPGYAHRMQEQTLPAGNGSQVRFHGIVDGEELSKLLHDAHLLVIPSYYEGFGIAYLEGMAFGLPGIGTTSGAASNLIKNGENGFLIEPGDSAALADYLHELASDRKLLRHLSLNALKTFQAQATWSDSMESVRMFLQNIIRENSLVSVRKNRQNQDD